MAEQGKILTATRVPHGLEGKLQYYPTRAGKPRQRLQKVADRLARKESWHLSTQESCQCLQEEYKQAIRLPRLEG